ncbi:MAG: integrase arm-type DNA-binding domain-containing protein [Terracidiphilus sp.]
MLLTDAKVRNAKPKEKDYRLPDSHGLYLFVTTGGAKLWRWRYRFGGKEQVMSFGAYPGIGISGAREAHEAARKVLAQGINPMAQKKQQREVTGGEQADVEAITLASDLRRFRNVATQWYDWWKAGKDERYIGFVKKRMDADILPKLGDLLMDDITPEQVASMVVAIEERGAEDVARRALQTTDQIFRWARSKGLTVHNPAGAFKPKDILKPMQRENFKRVDRRELPELLRRIHFHNGSPVTRLAMKLMALIFLRTSEMIEGQWSEIDFKEARWDIPAERMKGPKGKKRPHIVPLSRQAVALLEELWNYRKNDKYIFPGEQGATHLSNNTILSALDRIGYKGKMTGHGFRSIASTILHEKGYDHEHIEVQLAHAPQNDVAAAYNHAKYLGPRRKMMQDWADYLDETLEQGIQAARPERTTQPQQLGTVAVA